MNTNTLVSQAVRRALLITAFAAGVDVSARASGQVNFFGPNTPEV